MYKQCKPEPYRIIQCGVSTIRIIEILGIVLFLIFINDVTNLRPKMRWQLIHWSLKYQGVERLNLLGFSCPLRFECGMTFPTLFDSITLDEFKGAVNRWLLP